MKRALITMLAVLSLTGGVATTVATVSDARSNNQPARAEENDKDHGNKCDDDRSKKSTPKACKDKDKDDDDHGHGPGNHGDD